MKSYDAAWKREALYLATLTSYNMFYGDIPPALVKAVYNRVIRLSRVENPKVAQMAAQQEALIWLQEQLESEQKTAGSSTGKLPVSGPRPRDVLSGTRGSESRKKS